MEWLAQRQGLSDEAPGGEVDKSQDSALTLEDMIHIDHLAQKDPINNILNKFSLSSSGAIGIACHDGRPSLSVIYPGSSRPPQALSTEEGYLYVPSAVFIMKSAKDCLAAICSSTIHLWNLEDNTSSVIYKRKFDIGFGINLCVIDDRTVAYGEVDPSGDGCQKIYILMTNTQPWSLSSMLVVRGIELIKDMCYMKTTDGTACLLLSCLHDNNVQAVEIVGGRIRWKVGKQQMGEKCFPESICTNENNTVYVTDWVCPRIHILSGEDGSAIRSISLKPYGVIHPGCIRVHDQSIYIGHLDESQKKYKISKFRKSIDW